MAFSWRIPPLIREPADSYIGVTLWDIAEGRERAVLPGPSAPYAFTPDGKGLFLLSPHFNGAGVRLHDTQTGQLLLAFDHEGDGRLLDIFPISARKTWPLRRIPGRWPLPYPVLPTVTGAAPTPETARRHSPIG